MYSEPNRNTGKLIVFSAPSGSGKTTLVRHLLNQKELHLNFSISATSREKRGSEKHGKDYYFFSHEEFDQLIQKDAFIEWEEVYKDCFYGTLKSEVAHIWRRGNHVIFDIDVKGGLAIKAKYPERTLAIFVKPPSVDELEKRLIQRKTEDKEKIKIRLKKAERELSFAKKFDRIITNQDLSCAKEEAYKLVAAFIHQ